ncbi:hypothetical protein ACP275_11G050300 [Erythranthe tilingii]
MGSNYYGDGGLSSSTSSSRKGKKGNNNNNNSDKPKQPQRGLGVAQLEKIRLHTQLGCTTYLPPPSLHHNFPPTFNQEEIRLQTAYPSQSSTPYGYQPSHGVMMGLSDLDRTTIRYEDHAHSSTNIPRWHHGNNQHFPEPIITRPFFDPIVEGSIRNRNSNDRNENRESRSSEEIDLELRLSL